MLTIRLARVGKRNHPQYRLVLQQKTKSPSGKNLDLLGYYHPIEKKFECDVKKVEQYVKNGARPSSTVARLLTKNGVPGMEKFIDKIKQRSPKGEQPAAPAPAPSPAPAAPAKPVDQAEVPAA